MESHIVWTITAALVVYFMHAGFGFFEAGMCRSKNTVDTLSHNLLILAVTLLIYWGIGFGLMYGEGNSFIGLAGLAPRLLSPADYPSLESYPVPLAVAFAFAMSFADTPATLIAGSGAERIRFSAVMILTVLISGALFPLVGHWIVGGGWLSQLEVPVHDTGSGLVHLCGGCCALAVSLALGPRQEQEDQPDDPHRERQKKEVSSMPLVFLGAFILWLGFFAFNAGFAMHASKTLGLVVVNTALGGAAGTVAAMIGALIWTGKAELRTAIVGLLTANVAVTSPSAVVEPWAAATIGAIAGFVAVACIRLWVLLRVDDPTEYLTMNLIGGLLGMIAVGLFVSPSILQEYGHHRPPQPGLIYGGGAGQFVSQLIGAGAIIGFVLPTALLACWILRAGGGLRVSREEEREGADRSTHGEDAYEEQ